MKRDSIINLNSLEADARRLNAELSRISGSEKAEDVERCRWIKRELSRISSQYLEAFDGEHE